MPKMRHLTVVRRRESRTIFREAIGYVLTSLLPLLIHLYTLNQRLLASYRWHLGDFLAPCSPLSPDNLRMPSRNRKIAVELRRMSIDRASAQPDSSSVEIRGNGFKVAGKPVKVDRNVFRSAPWAPPAVIQAHRVLFHDRGAGGFINPPFDRRRGAEGEQRGAGSPITANWT